MRRAAGRQVHAVLAGEGDQPLEIPLALRLHDEARCPVVDAAVVGQLLLHELVRRVDHAFQPVLERCVESIHRALAFLP